MAKTALEEYRVNVRKFKNLNLNQLQLEDGEQIAHCIDSRSFGGEFYNPQWVVTNKGRVWTLRYNKWMVPQVVNGYWALVPKKDNISRTVYVHLLVCHYFKNDSDRIALEFFGENGVHGHHIKAIDIPKRFKGRGMNDEKIRRCMKDSCKSNVVYQEIRTDHINDTQMANGGVTIEEKNGTAVWSEELKDIRTMLHGSGQLKGNAYGTYYVYSKNENGELKKSINQTLKLKSLLDKYNVILGDYKVNADEDMQFVYDNQERILEKIKQNPPKTRDYDKGFILDGTSVLYALK